jgi:serine/threonine-protein phosphatase 2A regulatory subunit A
VKKEIVPIFQKLAKDDQDSVRLLVIESCVALAKMFDTEEKTSLVLPVVRATSVDKSWRVRYMMAEHFVEVRFAVFAISLHSIMLTSVALSSSCSCAMRWAQRSLKRN